MEINSWETGSGIWMMGATQEPRQNSSAVFELTEGLNPLQSSSVILSFFGVPCSE